MQTITVDMTPGFRQPTIHYSQNDVGTTFAIDLRSRFGDTLPASPTVKIQATKPSGFGFSIEADSVVGSLATFTTVDTMTDEAGRFQAELQIIKDAVVIYTANFYMEGEANPHPIGTTDGSQETIIPTLTLLVERVEAAASSVLDMTVEAETLAAGSQATYSYDEDTNTATFGIPQGEAGAGAAGVTASAYSSSKTYAVGDYVIHNSNLYRCTTAITTAESFTAAHWTQVVLADDVSDVKSDLVTYAPDNNNIVLSDVAKTDTTGRAWYQYENAVYDTPNADNIKSVVALSDVEDGVQINYSSFTGGGARTQLMLCTSGVIGATVVKYWATISASIDIGNLDGNILTISKAKITELYPTATHIFINIDKTSGSIKGVVYLADETTAESIERINSSLDNINDELNEALTVGTKVVPKAIEVTNGAYLYASSGVITALSDAAYSKFSVQPYETYYITTKLTGNVGICFYKADGTYISGLSTSDFGAEVLTDAKVDIPANCYILGISTKNKATNPLAVKEIVAKNGTLISKGDAIKVDASGDIVTFYDGADGSLLDSYKVSIDAENGATEAVIVRTGKNMLPRFASRTDAGITFTVGSDGSVTISGTSTRNNVSTDFNLPSSIVKMLDERKVTISGGGNSKIYMQLKIVANGSTIYRTTASRGNLTIDMPSGITAIQAFINVATSGTSVNTKFYPQIELGALPTKYEPFSYEEYSVGWSAEAGSITSGELDVMGGKLTVSGTTYDIAKTLITSLLGANNIFCDVGDSFVTYVADTKLYASIDVLTKSPKYIANNLCYKELGVLSKPYICLSTDDGEEELATYTIPMVISKGVPMTFCIWSESEVMLDDTYTAVVVDAVNNHGCEIAQHGRDAWANGSSWTDRVPTEQQLYEYWESEKIAFAEKGLTPKGCACPYGYVSPVMMAEANGYFGMNRSVYNYSEDWNVMYDNDCCGPRTNINALVATNIKDYSLDDWKAKIDYAIAHNYLLVIYLHDYDLSATAKATLEGVIDYAKTQSITFCNLGDIPKLT